MYGELPRMDTLIHTSNTGDNTMRKSISKLALTAVLTLAITLTLSCSSGDGGGDGQNGSSVTGGADGGGNQFSQLYNGYYDEAEEDVFHSSTAYNGSGVIKLLAYDESNNEILINAGNVTDGVVKLALPSIIPSEYLSEFFESYGDFDAYNNCIKFIQNIKVYPKDNEDFYLALFNSSGGYIGDLGIIYSDKQIRETISYMYFSKSGEITCNYEQKQTGRNNSIINVDIDAKAGWNKIYTHYNWDKNYAGSISAAEISTNNILTKEMKWTIQTK
ncbi:hypothetical protein R83H12_00764 [Fibrobacteria bacterium R8-3-H12]